MVGDIKITRLRDDSKFRTRQLRLVRLSTWSALISHCLVMNIEPSTTVIFVREHTSELPPTAQHIAFRN